MANRVIALILALLFGCAGADVDDDYDTDDQVIELGQTSEALLVPSYYGNQASSGGLKCFPGMSGTCNIPANKSVWMKFDAGSCSSWWQTRMVESEVSWKATIQGAGWTYTSGGNGPGFTVQIHCNQSSTPTCGGGAYACNKNQVSTCSSGKCKVTFQDIYIETYIIEHDTFEVNWPAQSEARRQNYGRNVPLHEMGHTIGSGHDTYNDGVSGDPAVNNSQLSTAVMYVSAIENLNANRTLSTAWLISDLKNYQP